MPAAKGKGRVARTFEWARLTGASRVARHVMGVALTLVVIGSAALGCAYPRRTTALSPAPVPRGGTIGAPDHAHQLTIVSAQVGPRRGALDWDEGGGAPDCFVRIFRDDTLVFESPTVDDSRTPGWGLALPRNVRIPPDSRVRLEVWDRDAIGADPVGIWRGVGLPSGMAEGTDEAILLEGDSYLTLRIDAARPHRGVGIRSYEERPGEILVVEVEPFSPAARAGIEAGDHILAIGDHTVGALGANAAAGALSMAADRGQRLRVRSARGEERVLELDHGFTWLVM